MSCNIPYITPANALLRGISPRNNTCLHSTVVYIPNMFYLLFCFSGKLQSVVVHVGALNLHDTIAMVIYNMFPVMTNKNPIVPMFTYSLIVLLLIDTAHFIDTKERPRVNICYCFNTCHNL
mgnify:CR=1 FL=1